jgi:hypothetical protein
MKTIVKPGSLRPGRLVIAVSTVLMALSCSKSNNSDTPTKTKLKYCATTSWSNTYGQSGTFTGAAVDGTYALVYAEYKEKDGTVGGFPLHYDANNHLINDQPGVTYTYTQDYLSQIHIDLQNGNGNGSYNFDSKGHFTSGVINFTSQGFSGPLTATYTYDSNEDPVKISAVGSISTDQGTFNIDIEVTGDFLQDKTSLLPFIPVFAPASGYFSPYPFLSKHLLNKWVATLTASLGGQNLTYNFNYQYTYTFDNNGNVATMVHTGNPSNIYTFTYTDCN